MNRVWRWRRSPRHHRENTTWVVDLDVRFTDDEWRMVEDSARSMEVSPTVFLRHALREWLDTHKASLRR